MRRFPANSPSGTSTPGDVPARLADASMETVGGAGGQGHFSNLNTKHERG